MPASQGLPTEGRGGRCRARPEQLVLSSEPVSSWASVACQLSVPNHGLWRYLLLCISKFELIFFFRTRHSPTSLRCKKQRLSSGDRIGPPTPGLPLNLLFLSVPPRAPSAAPRLSLKFISVLSTSPHPSHHHSHLSHHPFSPDSHKLSDPFALSSTEHQTDPFGT